MAVNFMLFQTAFTSFQDSFCRPSLRIEPPFARNKWQPLGQSAVVAQGIRVPPFDHGYRSPGASVFTLRFLRSFSQLPDRRVPRCYPVNLLAGRRSAQSVRCLTIGEHPIFPDPQPSMVDHFGVMFIEPRDGGE